MSSDIYLQHLQTKNKKIFYYKFKKYTFLQYVLPCYINHYFLND